MKSLLAQLEVSLEWESEPDGARFGSQLLDVLIQLRSEQPLSELSRSLGLNFINAPLSLGFIISDEREVRGDKSRLRLIKGNERLLRMENVAL